MPGYLMINILAFEQDIRTNTLLVRLSCFLMSVLEAELFQDNLDFIAGSGEHSCPLDEIFRIRKELDCNVFITELLSLIFLLKSDRNSALKFEKWRILQRIFPNLR